MLVNVNQNLGNRRNETKKRLKTKKIKAKILIFMVLFFRLLGETIHTAQNPKLWMSIMST